MLRSLSFALGIATIFASLAMTITFQPRSASAGEFCNYLPFDTLTSGVSFTDECAAHDYCYSGVPGKLRSTCDQEFYNAMMAHCDQYYVRFVGGDLYYNCRRDAGTIFTFVHNYGSNYWGGGCYLDDLDGVSCSPDCVPGGYCRVAEAEPLHTYDLRRQAGIVV